MSVGESLRAMFANALLVRQEEGAEVDLQVGRTVTKAPRYMRTQLWLGVLQRHPGLGNRAAQQYHAYLRKPVPELVLDDISKDVGRTFPNIPQFQAPAGRAGLARVLRAYAALDPEVNYCQGMNFLAALLLVWMPGEAQAFGGLVVLMRERGLRGLYKTDMGALQARLWQVGELLPPGLRAHLEAHSVLPVLYASSWLLTAFAADFPLFWSSRVMDVILTDCYIEPMMKVVLGLMRTLQPALLRSNDMERMVRFIKAAPPRWPHAALQEVLTDSLAMEWTPAQAALLARTEGAETVVQAVARVQHMAQEDAAAPAAAAAAAAEPAGEGQAGGAHLLAPARPLPRGGSAPSWARRMSAPVSLACPPASPFHGTPPSPATPGSSGREAGEGGCAPATRQPSGAHLLDSPPLPPGAAAAGTAGVPDTGGNGGAAAAAGGGGGGGGRRPGAASPRALAPGASLDQLSSASSFGEFTGSLDAAGLGRRGSGSGEGGPHAPAERPAGRAAHDSGAGPPAEARRRGSGLQGIAEGPPEPPEAPAGEPGGEAAARPRPGGKGARVRPESSGASLLDEDWCVPGLPAALAAEAPPPSPGPAEPPPGAASSERRLGRAATLEARLQRELSSLAVAVGQEPEQG